MTISGGDEIDLFLETEGLRDWCLVCLAVGGKRLSNRALFRRKA